MFGGGADGAWSVSGVCRWISVIEAADLAEAIEKISQVPCAIGHGVLEVWPLK
jgi:hypothetical protein